MERNVFQKPGSGNRIPQYGEKCIPKASFGSSAPHFFAPDYSIDNSRRNKIDSEHLVLNVSDFFSFGYLICLLLGIVIFVLGARCRHRA